MNIEKEIAKFFKKIYHLESKFLKEHEGMLINSAAMTGSKAGMYNILVKKDER